MTRSGALEPSARGVFLVRGAPLTYSAELWVAVLSGLGILGFATATHLWGVSDRPPLIDLVIDDHRRVSAPPSTRLRRTFVPASAIVDRNGLPITTRAWSLIDQLGALSHSDAIRLCDRALQRGWLRRRDLEQRLQDYPGRHGNTQLRQLLEQTADGAAAESERRLHRILRSGGITGWVANHAVWHEGELVAVVDVAFINWRVALEVDGMAFHTDVDRFQRDRERQNALVALGWTVLRFTWADLTERPDYVLAAIRQAA
jgi:very-short-patch-repair endonuclease